MKCGASSCNIKATYGAYCPLHVHGASVTTSYMEFFYEALYYTHLHGNNNKFKWAKLLFDILPSFGACETFQHVYGLVKQHVISFGGKNPLLFLYDVTAKICRKFNIPILKVPNQAFLSGAPKAWLPYLNNIRDPYEVYKIMRKHLNSSKKKELDIYWGNIYNSLHVGDYLETLLCYFKPYMPQDIKKIKAKLR